MYRSLVTFAIILAAPTILKRLSALGQTVNSMVGNWADRRACHCGDGPRASTKHCFISFGERKLDSGRASLRGMPRFKAD